MTLSRLALLSLLIIALSACGTLETTAPSMLATPTMGAGEVVATQEPTAQPSPTPSLMPTQNAPATVAAMEMTAASDNLKAANVEATAIVVAAQIAANAVSTQAAVDLLMLEKSETGQTNRALIALTAQAVEVEGKKADAQIIEGQNEAEQIRQDGQTMLIKQIMGWIVAILAVVFVGVFMWRLATGRRAPDDEADDEDDEPDQPLPEYAAGIRLAIFTAPEIGLGGRNVRRFCRAIVDGEKLTYRNLVHDLGILTESAVKFLQYGFVNSSLARWKHGVPNQGFELLPRGEKFAREVCQTTSPLPATVATLQNQPVKDTIRQDDTGLGEGAGWITEREKP